MSVLTELIAITEEFDPTSPEFQGAAATWFGSLIKVAQAAQGARAELNRQIPHSKRTFNALQKLSAVDLVDNWPFRHNYNKNGIPS